jgi:hypothetical protein
VSAAEMQVHLEAIKDAVKNFQATQQKYCKYGAYDTEPDSVFQGILWKIIHDKDVNIPQTGDGWELYAASMDCSEAAAALHASCLCVVQAIWACPHKDMREVRKHIEDYCWRYN